MSSFKYLPTISSFCATSQPEAILENAHEPIAFGAENIDSKVQDLFDDTLKYIG